MKEIYRVKTKISILNKILEYHARDKNEFPGIFKLSSDIKINSTIVSEELQVLREEGIIFRNILPLSFPGDKIYPRKGIKTIYGVTIKGKRYLTNLENSLI